MGPRLVLCAGRGPLRTGSIYDALVRPSSRAISIR